MRTEISSQEIEKQLEICHRIRERRVGNDHPFLALVDTYGCQQNEADSEKLRGYLAEMGYGFTQDEYAADLIVVNTCAVREHAEMRILGNVGHLSHSKKKNAAQRIVLCGCMVQQAHMAERIKKSFPIVDLVFGPHELWRFPELLEQVLPDTEPQPKKRRRLFETAPSDGCIAEGIPTRRDGGVKAWLSVMYGCNNFCTYCVVPYVRGRERSRSSEAVLADARRLIGEGVKDLTLLGQNVNSYGLDLPNGEDFAALIRRVNAIEGDFLIRFMTSHPKDATEKLFAAMAESEKCAHHIHLPVQAGNDRVLKVMNRRYTAEDYLKLVEMARRYLPDLVLTSDIIVGFPGETDEEFEDTLRLCETVQFDSLFTFLFSPRQGTFAASMPDPFTKEEKQQRFDRLLETQNAISLKKHSAMVGSTLRVLVDGRGEGEFPLTARTNGGRLVHMKGDASLIGSFAKAKITGANTWALYGEPAEGEN